VHKLSIPLALQNLVEQGLWPIRVRSDSATGRQPIVPPEVIRNFAPEEESIFLYSYPFYTISEARLRNEYWGHERNALEEVDPELSLVIGDFGLGSDTALILDYRSERPQLMRLKWGETENHWVECKLSIEDLADIVRKYQAR
jgi:hypothetical protein